jgi:hypothetical protein
MSYDVQAVIFDLHNHNLTESLLLKSVTSRRTAGILLKSVSRRTAGIDFIYHYQLMIRFVLYSYEDLPKLEDHVNRICIFYQNQTNEQVP